MTDAAEPPRVEPTAKPRWVRWARIAGSGLGLLIALRLAAPMVISWALERALTERVEAPVEVGELDLDVLTPGFAASEIRTLHDDGVASLDIERVDAHWSWADLVRFDARTRISVVRPHVVLDLDAGEAKVPEMKGVEIDRLAAFEIVDGVLHLAIDTASGRSDLRISDVQVELVASSWEASRQANVEASMSVGEHGTLEATARLSSALAAQDWDLEFALDDLDLRSLGAVWLDLLEMDVESGRLDIKGRLKRARDRLRGELTPRFEELRFVGMEESTQHGIGAALFGHMLAGADSTIEIDRDIGTATGATFTEIFGADWEQLIASIIQRGYGRRLGTLEGYDATIGNVEVEFDAGLIILEDIVLTRSSRRVPVPFLSVKRLEVLFDPQVADPDDADEAYKHIVLWGPELTLVKGLDESRSQLRFDPDWVDKISAMPFRTRDVIVHDGRITYLDETEEDEIKLFVADLELVGTEMARGLCEKGVRGAMLMGSAKIQGTAEANVAVTYEPAADVANAEVGFTIGAVPLEALEPLLQAKAGITVAGGMLELQGHVVAADRHVDATIDPKVYGVQLEAIDDGKRVREFTKNLLERRLRRLGGRTLELSYDYGPDEKAFGSFASMLLRLAVQETKRKRFFGTRREIE